MVWPNFHDILVIIQHTVSFFGIFIILIGVLFALFHYIKLIATSRFEKDNSRLNVIRLELARTLLLGLEFIVAADLIGTTTAPDYYTVGILAIIVIIRTMLSFTLNRELHSVGKN